MAITENHQKSPTLETRGSKRVANQVERKFTFTEKRIAKLPRPESGRSYYYDTKVRGLAVAVSPERKSYLLYRKFQGKPMRYTIGPCSDLSLDDARKEAEEKNAGILRGKNPAEDKRKLRSEATLRDAFDAYLANADLRPKTRGNHESIFRCHLLNLALHKISAIKQADVLALHSKIGRTGKQHQANRVVELLSAVYNYAIGDGWEGTNPATKIKSFKERKRKRRLSGPELVFFFRALSEEPNSMLRDFFALALLTGVRRSNLQEMLWTEISFKDALWTIPASKAKSDEPIEVFLVVPALKLLANRKEASKSEFVFPSKKSATGHLTEPKSAWSRLLKRAAELEREEWKKANPRKPEKEFEPHDFASLRIHDLRRTFGSFQYMLGAPLGVIGKSLGHESGSPATAIYSLMDLDPVRTSVSAATTRLLTEGSATEFLGDGQ